mgnify:CR=1 FL=1
MGKIIQINLNQTINKAVLAEMKKENTRWWIFGSIVAVFLVCGGVLYSYNSSLGSLIDQRETRIDDIIVKTKSLKKEGIDLSKKDIESYHNFEIGRIFWAKKLELLSSITPDYMAITELDYRNGRFVVSAISQVNPDEKDFMVIDKFINLLKDTDEFSQTFKTIKFLNSERSVSRGVEILSFKVEAKLDQKKIKKLKRKSNKV